MYDDFNYSWDDEEEEEQPSFNLDDFKKYLPFLVGFLLLVVIYFIYVNSFVFVKIEFKSKDKKTLLPGVVYIRDEKGNDISSFSNGDSATLLFGKYVVEFICDDESYGEGGYVEKMINLKFGDKNKTFSFLLKKNIKVIIEDVILPEVVFVNSKAEGQIVLKNNSDNAYKLKIEAKKVKSKLYTISAEFIPEEVVVPPKEEVKVGVIISIEGKPPRRIEERNLEFFITDVYKKTKKIKISPPPKLKISPSKLVLEGDYKMEKGKYVASGKITITNPSKTGIKGDVQIKGISEDVLKLLNYDKNIYVEQEGVFNLELSFEAGYDEVSEDIEEEGKVIIDFGFKKLEIPLTLKVKKAYFELDASFTKERYILKEKELSLKLKICNKGNVVFDDLMTFVAKDEEDNICLYSYYDEEVQKKLESGKCIEKEVLIVPSELPELEDGEYSCSFKIMYSDPITLEEKEKEVKAQIIKTS